MYFKKLLFSDSFCHFLSQFSVGSHYVTNNPQLLRKGSRKNVFISATTSGKYIDCKSYRSAHHNEKTCFLPACKNHIVLLGNVQRLVKIRIHFASPINTWTVCIHFSRIDSVEKLSQRVDKCLIRCNKQLTLITETREWTECRALQNSTFEEKIQKTFVQLLSKDINNADQWFTVCRKN